LGTQLRLSSAFRLQTDDQSEVTNYIISMYLWCLTSDRPKNWLWWLPWAEYCYNTSHQTALKTTPLQVVYGRAPLPMISFQEGATKVPAVDRQLRDRDMFLAEIREWLLQAQAHMKKAHDADHRDVEFDTGT
jgi:hypothetical protein